jgi:cell division protein FtsB
MTIFYHAKRRFRPQMRNVVVQLIGACTVAYFAYHAIEGDRGLVAMTHVQSEIAQAEARLNAVTAEHDKMEQRAGLLRPNHLDPDMLDERARAMLDWSNPNDVIILRKNTDKSENAK